MKVDIVLTTQQMEGNSEYRKKYYGRMAVIESMDGGTFFGPPGSVGYTTTIESACRYQVIHIIRNMIGSSPNRLHILSQDDDEFKVDFSMTWSQLEALRSLGSPEYAALKNRACIIQHTDGTDRYYRARADAPDTRATCRTFTVEEGRQLCSNRSDWFHILKKNPLPDGKLCLVDQVLPAPLIKLLQASPGNPIVRTQVLAAIKREIPAEHQTYEQISNWIEATYDGPPALGWGVQEDNTPRPTPVMTTRRVDPATTGRVIALTVDASDVEVGTCNYQYNRYGEAQVDLTADDIIEAMDGQDDIDDVIHTISAILIEKAEERIELRRVDEDPPDLNNFNMSDTNNYNASITDRHSLVNAVMTWLQVNRPDDLRRLRDEVVEAEEDETDDHDDHEVTF